MMRYAVIDNSGTVLRHGSCAPDMMSIQASDPDTVVELPDEIDDPESYIVLDGEWTARVIDPVEALASAKAAKRHGVKQLREMAESAGCMTATGRVDSDPESQRKVAGAVQMAMIVGDDFSIDWRMQDNSIVTLGRAGMIAMGLAVGQHVSACQAHKNVLDGLIDDADTIEELAAIDIGTGWPG